MEENGTVARTMSQKELHLSQRQFMKPLSPWRKLVFSLGNFSWAINTGIIGIFQITFLLEVVQLTPDQVSTIMLVKQIYDALTDPVVGVLSDNTNTRFGRRKPWIVTFILPMAVVWILMWTYNGTVLNNEWEVYLYYFGVILLYSTLQTLVNIPYQALVPDVSPEYNDRTTIVMLSQFFSIIASTTSIFIWSTLVVMFPSENVEVDGTKFDYKKGYVIAAVITSIPIFFATVIAILPVKERPNLKAEEEMGEGRKGNVVIETLKIFLDMLRGMKDLITFPPFLCVAVINIVGGLSQALVMNSINLWIKYWLAEEERGNMVLTIAQIGIIFGIVFFSLLAKRITKKWSLVIGSVIGFCAFVALYFVPPGGFIFALVFMFIEGFAAGAGFVLPPAMLPDVIEMDERRTGIRREGLFYSFFLLLEKLAVAIAQSGSSFALGQAGYINPRQQAQQGTVDEQPDSVLLTLRIMLWILPALLRFVIIPAALLFPIICKRYGFNERGQLISETQKLDTSDDRGDRNTPQ